MTCFQSDTLLRRIDFHGGSAIITCLKTHTTWRSTMVGGYSDDGHLLVNNGHQDVENEWYYIELFDRGEELPNSLNQYQKIL